jgi:hypothetical protein
MVEIVDHVAAVIEVNEVNMVFVANAVDVCDQILVFLFPTVDVARLVNHPGDARVWWDLSQDLFRPNPC